MKSESFPGQLLFLESVIIYLRIVDPTHVTLVARHVVLGFQDQQHRSSWTGCYHTYTHYTHTWYLLAAHYAIEGF